MASSFSRTCAIGVLSFGLAASASAQQKFDRTALPIQEPGKINKVTVNVK